MNKRLSDEEMQLIKEARADFDELLTKRFGLSEEDARSVYLQLFDHYMATDRWPSGDMWLDAEKLADGRPWTVERVMFTLIRLMEGRIKDEQGQ